MSNSPEKGASQVNISTPERKKEYVKSWLEKHPDTFSTLDSNELTPDIPSLSQCQKQLFPRTPPRSPAVAEKRSASSPILGGLRRSLKRMKVQSKIAKFDEEKPSCSKAILNENCSKKDFAQEKACEPHFLDQTKILELQDAFSISAASDDGTPNIFHDIAKQKIEPNSTQFIESVSSDHNTESMELVQEAASDTDKTPSDLVEDEPSQLNYESPPKSKQTCMSQKISTPSSTSSEQTNEDHITDSNTRDHTDPQIIEVFTPVESNTRDQTDPQITEVFTPADQIDTASTIESKGESSRIQFIVPFEKPSKKNKAKKGSLSELLKTTMGKEKSSVTLLKHQLKKNPPDIEEPPFVLLQILQYLPNFNGNQFLQCVLVEDTADLMKNLVKNKRNVITVMNVPEISCTINIKQKPILKVYEPWTVIDPSQLLIHITIFTAIPGAKENLDFNNVDNKVLKLVEEFHCPCIDKNALSNECESKFCDSRKNIIKMISN